MPFKSYTLDTYRVPRGVGTTPWIIDCNILLLLFVWDFVQFFIFIGYIVKDSKFSDLRWTFSGALHVANYKYTKP